MVVFIRLVNRYVGVQSPRHSLLLFQRHVAWSEARLIESTRTGIHGNLSKKGAWSEAPYKVLGYSHKLILFFYTNPQIAVG